MSNRYIEACHDFKLQYILEVHMVLIIQQPWVQPFMK